MVYVSKKKRAKDYKNKKERRLVGGLCSSRSLEFTEESETEEKSF